VTAPAVDWSARASPVLGSLAGHKGTVSAGGKRAPPRILA